MWLTPYLLDVGQFVKIGRHQAGSVSCDLGLPQGAVLGPQLLVAYISPESDIVTSAGFGFHQYTDDTQIYFVAINQDLDALRIRTERLLNLRLTFHDANT
jgi:hypothetical protein